jgi:hypothetical protein
MARAPIGFLIKNKTEYQRYKKINIKTLKTKLKMTKRNKNTKIQIPTN